MNLKRAIGGFLLSFVFLLFFAYMASGVQWVFENSSQNQNKELFLGSVSDSIQKNPSIESIGNLEIDAQSAISVFTNLSEPDKTLLSKNGQRILSIASLSKLMTALIVIENIDLSQKITISEKAASQSTDPELLKTGETFYAEDLLQVALIGSNNVASFALSESIGTDRFVDLMNNKAKEMGLLNTSFLNSTGLGLDNFSTTQDLVKMTEYLLKSHPSVFEITTATKFDLHDVDGKISYKIINTNELLKDSSDLTRRIIGGKTGETRTAGECLLLVIKSLDNQGYLINVILNSNDRFEKMKKIISWADENYNKK